MCITYTVGRGGRNDLADVTIVQILLNQNLQRFPAALRPEPLKPDGRIGTNTLTAIERFETAVMGLPESDAIVSPDDVTMKALLAGLPGGASPDKLAIIVPRALREKIELYYPSLVDAMTQHGISTPLQIAHFIAQVGLESGNFFYAEEIASGAAYEGRKDLGNTQAGDGVRFKGRGLIQLTGRANYTAYAKDRNLADLLDHPQRIAADPLLCVDVACWFWVKNGLGPLADRDDIRGITKRINGAADGPHTHLDERIANLRRAKAVMGL